VLSLKLYRPLSGPPPLWVCGPGGTSQQPDLFRFGGWKGGFEGTKSGFFPRSATLFFVGRLEPSFRASVRWTIGRRGRGRKIFSVFAGYGRVGRGCRGSRRGGFGGAEFSRAFRARFRPGQGTRPRTGAGDTAVVEQRNFSPRAAPWRFDSPHGPAGGVLRLGGQFRGSDWALFLKSFFHAKRPWGHRYGSTKGRLGTGAIARILPARFENGGFFPRRSFVCGRASSRFFRGR